MEGDAAPKAGIPFPYYGRRNRERALLFRRLLKAPEVSDPQKSLINVGGILGAGVKYRRNEE